jgi:hypothetical protein
MSSANTRSSASLVAISSPLTIGRQVSEKIDSASGGVGR